MSEECSTTIQSSQPAPNNETSDENNNVDDVQCEYRVRYEDLLLQQNQLTNTFLSYSSLNNLIENDDNNGNSTVNHTKYDFHHTQLGVAAILSNHAAMDTMLRSALHNSKLTKEKDDDEVEALTQLLEHTIHQQNFDEDMHMLPNKFGDDRIPFGRLCAMAGLDRCRSFALPPRRSRNDTKLSAPGNGVDGVPNNCDAEDDDDSVDLVDGFFEDYPECIRKVPIVFDDIDKSENIDITNNENLEGRKNGQAANRNNKNHESISDPISMTASTAGVDNNQMRRNPCKSPRNSVGSSSSSSVVSSYPDNNKNSRFPRKQPSDEHQHSSSSWDIYAPQKSRNEMASSSATSSLLSRKKNPFCTAKELSSGGREEVNEDATEDYYNDEGLNGMQGNHHQQYGQAPSNPYQRKQNTQGYYHQPRQQQNQSIPQNNPNRPSLSAGLKRKFQLPKPRKSINDNQPRNNADRTDRNRNRHQSSAGGYMTSSKSNTATNSNKNEDEELPEELSHLDKELVQKIQSEIVDHGDPITFADIAGLIDAKQTVMELVCWPMKRPDLFTGLRRGPNGLLLFGPPGTGKTLIGKAIAHESGATFFSISSSSLTSKWIGEGEKLVRTLFAVAAYREPSVVFIDEIDSLLTQRKSDENEASRRIKTEFLVQLDGTGTSGQGRVLVIGATNRPHELDDAARRRFVKRLYIPLPKQSDRETLLRTLLSKNNNSLSDKELIKLSSETDGFSGADLKALCTDAALGPIRQLGVRALEIDARDVPPISYKHFRHALRGMNPSVAQADLEVYLEWNNTYGSKSVTAEDYDCLTDDYSNGGADE